MIILHIITMAFITATWVILSMLVLDNLNYWYVYNSKTKLLLSVTGATLLVGWFL